MNQKRYIPPVALAALFSAAALVSQPGSAQGVGGTRPLPAPAPAPSPAPSPSPAPAPAPAPVDIADRVGPDGYTPRNRPCPSYLPNCHDPVPLSLRFLPRIAEIPVGATSGDQVVVKRSPTFLPNPLNDPSLPTMREIAKSDAKGRQYLNAVIPVLEAAKMLPNITDRPIIITMAALDLKGTMSQENPTSPPPTCPYGYASGPTWSGWDAVGWQYACNPPPAPPPASSPTPPDAYCVGEHLYLPSVPAYQICSIYCATPVVTYQCNKDGALEQYWGRLSTASCAWGPPELVATVPNWDTCPQP